MLHFRRGEMTAEVAEEGLRLADGLLYALIGGALPQTDVVRGEQDNQQGGGGEDKQDAVEVLVGVVHPILNAFRRRVRLIPEVLNLGLQLPYFLRLPRAFRGGVGEGGRDGWRNGSIGFLPLRGGGNTNQNGEKRCAFHTSHSTIFRPTR